MLQLLDPRRFLAVGFGEGTPVLVQNGDGLSHGHRLQTLDIVGEFLSESDGLVGEDRQDRHQHHGEDDDKKPEDQQRGQETTHVHALQPPHDGVEQIGEAYARREGRDRRTQQMQEPEHDQQHRRPDEDLPFERHAWAPCAGSIKSHLPPQRSMKTATVP